MAWNIFKRRVCQCGDPVILEPKGEGKCIQCRRPYTELQALTYKLEQAQHALARAKTKRDEARRTRKSSKSCQDDVRRHEGILK